MQHKELSLGRTQQQCEGDLFWGQPLHPLGCGKALEQGEMGCRELQGCAPGASGFQTAPRQGDSWAGTEPVWLCWLCPGVQISRYLFAETPEGGKSRNILPR